MVFSVLEANLECFCKRDRDVAAQPQSSMTADECSPEKGSLFFSINKKSDILIRMAKSGVILASHDARGENKTIFVIHEKSKIWG